MSSISLSSSGNDSSIDKNSYEKGNTTKKTKSLDRVFRSARVKCYQLQLRPSFIVTQKSVLWLLICSGCIIFMPRLGFDDIKTNVKTDPHKVDKPNNREGFDPCTNGIARKGVIVSTLQGRLGNNIFEIGFAHALAKKLCLPIVYRYQWAPSFHDPEVFRCFPNVDMAFNFQNASGTGSNNNHAESSSMLRHDLNLSVSVWNSMTHLTEEGSALQSQVYYDFVSRNSERVFSCPHMECDFHNITSMAEAVSNNHHYQMVNLDAFFILYDWIQNDGNGGGNLALLKHVFSMKRDCCITPPPPDDAVVIHVRNFQDGDHGIKNVPWNVSIYESIVEKYYSSPSPNSVWPIVWVVCEPHTRQSQLVQDLQYGKLQAKVFHGVTPVDAHCILQRAKRLILSTCSTFSQSAALLTSSADVHYPTYTARYPKVTLKVPEWKYHLVAHYYDSTQHKIVEWDINHTNIEVLPG